jgi:hypothetical protein
MTANAIFPLCVLAISWQQVVVELSQFRTEDVSKYVYMLDSQYGTKSDIFMHMDHKMYIFSIKVD